MKVACQHERLSSMRRWLDDQVGADYTLTALAGDASFRRYYRIRRSEFQAVVMDAPADVQSSYPFCALAQSLAAEGVRTPAIYHADLTRGFLCLEDFGETLLYQVLTPESADDWYARALSSLLKLQRIPAVKDYTLPCFSAETMLMELSWFEQWYLSEYCRVDVTDSQRAALSRAYQRLVDLAMSQPHTLIHKDYHSRNIMVLADNEIGVIDFQDAMMGPIAYDVMSLLYDHYIAWPRERIVGWVSQYRAQLQQAGLLAADVSEAQFLLWHDALTLQRVMKNCGNFVRLDREAGKPGYLKDLPRIYKYLMDITAAHAEFSELATLLPLWQPKEN